LDAGNLDSKRVASPSDTQEASILLDFHVFSDTKLVIFRCNRGNDPFAQPEFYPRPVGVLGQRGLRTNTSDFCLIPSVRNVS
jgi:hypothetical protein